VTGDDAGSIAVLDLAGKKKILSSGFCMRKVGECRLSRPFLDRGARLRVLASIL
jgi:hypothetical protein